jgi:hypothetical protein
VYAPADFSAWAQADVTDVTRGQPVARVTGNEHHSALASRRIRPALDRRHYTTDELASVAHVFAKESIESGENVDNGIDVFVAVPDGARRAALEKLAAQGPVHRVTLPSGRPGWLVTGNAEARTALTDPRLARQRLRLSQ